MGSQTNAFKVKLSPKIRRDEYDRPVVFDVTPDLTENRNVNYKSLDPVHMPGAIHVYSNTASRNYTISNIKLISRSPEEASHNLARINLLRSWTMPRFGRGSITADQSKYGAGLLDAYKDYTEAYYPYDKPAANHGRSLRRDSQGKTNGRTLTGDGRQITEGEELLGAPPMILLLTAYASTNLRGNIYRIPTVITNVTIPYPSDVDYIYTLGGHPFPTIMSIDMQLVEVHSPREYELFSLEQFRNGDLRGF